MPRKQARDTVSPEVWRDYKRLLRLADPDHARERERRNYAQTRDAIKARKKAYADARPGFAYQRSKRYRDTHKDLVNSKRRVKSKARYNSDPNYRLRRVLADRIIKALAGRYKAGLTLPLLGCSLKDFRLYLESRWETGMDWGNYGPQGWHVDHIMPCAIFDLAKPEHQQRCFHFSNLQPMWAGANLVKGAKAPAKHQFQLL